MKTLRLLAGLFVMVILWGCGGGGDSTPAAPAAGDITGTWIGSVTSSVSGSRTATLNVSQTGNNVTGNYSTTAGAMGSVSGTVSGTTLSFTITPTQVGCTGSLPGSGNITTPSVGQPSMSFNYNGSSTCGGPESGTGNLTKQ